jgi:hypothetical protein
MSGYVKFERPFLIRSAAGLAYYESAAFVQGIEDVWNGHATTTITRGMAVRIDTTTANISVAASSLSYIPRWDYSTAGTDVTFATVCKISVIPVSSATDVCLLGVALENIPPGATGRICTDGLCAVNCVSGQCTTIGQAAIGSTTPGSVAGSATPGVGMALGMIVVAAGTGNGTMLSATQCLVKIGHIPGAV